MASTWIALKRLSLGLLLIAAASAILLLSDRGQRAQAGSRRVVPVAIVQHASTPVLDAGVQGVIQGLAEQGYRDGETLAITTYNAHGDLATGNTIARQVTTGEFEMVITSSTPSMQAVANANRDGRVMHVFTLVADPFSAGVGLDREHPLKHPAAAGGAGLVPAGGRELSRLPAVRCRASHGSASPGTRPSRIRKPSRRRHARRAAISASRCSRPTSTAAPPSPRRCSRSSRAACRRSGSAGTTRCCPRSGR